MNGFTGNRLPAPLVRFASSPVLRSRPTTIVAFAVIALMMAFVIYHNERFLIDPTNPV